MATCEWRISELSDVGVSSQIESEVNGSIKAWPKEEKILHLSGCLKNKQESTYLPFRRTANCHRTFWLWGVKEEQREAECTIAPNTNVLPCWTTPYACSLFRRTTSKPAPPKVDSEMNLEQNVTKGERNVRTNPRLLVRVLLNPWQKMVDFLLNLLLYCSIPTLHLVTTRQLVLSWWANKNPNA